MPDHAQVSGTCLGLARLLGGLLSVGDDREAIWFVVALYVRQSSGGPAIILITSDLFVILLPGH